MQQTNTPRIKTTVVGSYPVPDWLAALPSEQALIDATRVVIHIQEQAGIDLVCDGELSRFDVNHPETNGMIEYFVRPMAGIRTAMRFDELVAYRAQRGMGFRTRPPAVVEGPVGPGTLDLPQACARAKRLATRPFKFTLTGPHMLAKTLVDQHYGSCPNLRWRSPMRSPSRCAISMPTSCRSTKQTCPAVRTNGRGLRRRSTACCGAVKTVPAVHLCFGNYGGQSIQQGTWGKLIDYLNALAGRSRRHGDRAPAGGGTRGVSRAAAGDRVRPRRRRHQIDRDRERRYDRPRDRTGRENARTGAGDATSIRTAASGCSSAASPTARFAHLYWGVTDTRECRSIVTCGAERASDWRPGSDFRQSFIDEFARSGCTSNCVLTCRFPMSAWWSSSIGTVAMSGDFINTCRARGWLMRRASICSGRWLHGFLHAPARARSRLWART